MLPEGAPFQIASFDYSEFQRQDEVEGIAYGGGNYLVVYDKEVNPGGDSVVYGRIVSPSGTVGSEIAISSGYGHQGVHNVAFDGANFFVVWTDDINDSEVKGRFISPSGVLGTEISINTSSDPSDNPLTVAFDGTNYLVVYTDEFGGPGSGEWDVHGQMVTPSGALSGGVIFISTASGQQSLPLVAFDGTNYLVTWTDMRNDTNKNWACDTDEGTCWDIYGQYVSKTGGLVGSEFIVNNDAGNQLGGAGGFNNGKYLALINTGLSWDQPTENFIYGDVYGKFLGGYSLGTHNASGTYTWDSGTGTLTVNTTVSDFICDGLFVGTEIITEVAITTDTMTWSKDGVVDVTWTRSPAGTAGDIVGVWTMSDSYLGNSYTLTINSDTFSLAAVIIQCSSEGGGIQAYSQHWDSGYYAHFYVDDPTHQYTAVAVSGPYVSTVSTSYVCGPANCIDLVYDASNGGWSGWSNGSYISFGLTHPATPLTYTFELTDGTGTTSQTDDIESFVEPFATGLAPTGTVSTNPVFAWTGPNFYTYGVELHDNLGNTIWSVYDLTTPSIAYPGVPALTEGMTYNYNILVRDAYGNTSFAQASFVYQTAATPLYVAWTDDTYGNNEIFLKKSTDNGATWTFQRMTNNSGNSANPSVATSGANVYVAWQDDTYGPSGVPEIFMKRSADSGATWTFQRMTTNTGNSQSPAIAVNENEVYVVWQDDTYAAGVPEIFLKKSTDNGATWTFQRLTNNAGQSINPSIRVNGNNVYVVWQDDTYGPSGKPEIFMKRSADSGATWQFQRMTTNAGYSGRPSMVVDGSNIYVVWPDDSYGNYEIFFKKSTDGGNTWTFQRLTTNAGISGRPSIALSSGNLYVVWEDDTYGNNEIFFKKSIDGGNTWLFQRLTNNTGISVNPSIRVNGNEVYAVWQDDTYAAGVPEIFLKRSTDSGATWQFQRLTTNTGISAMPAMAR